jgi:tRNA-binding protein
MKNSDLSFDDFQKVEIKIGTILEAHLNEKARNPAYVLRLDFGEKIGVKTTSAQLTENYRPQDLVGKQVSAVMNFPPMRVAGVKSEVLVLAGVCEKNRTILLHPSSMVENGTSVA